MMQAQWDKYWQRYDAVQAATTVAQVNAVGPSFYTLEV